ncbi:MAG: M20/M25/M40 family metallo-hydrolase, partial [Acidobacteriota bacterium]
MLYLAPVVLFGLTWGVTRLAGRLDPDQSWHGVDFSHHESVQLFREYLTFDTSYPDGNEIPGAEFLARLLAAEGIEAHVERLGARNANLWAILEGDEHQALVLHNHIDVEPAGDAERWLHPPFSGTLDSPFIYGRGAFDMKSLAIAQLMSVLDLKRSGESLKRSLIFLATGDEERFSRLGTRRLIRHHPDLVDRFYAVLTEGGAVEATDLTEVKYWGTDFGQKRFVDVWVCDASRERLADLRKALIAKDPRPRAALESVRKFFAIYSETRSNPELGKMLRQPDKMIEADRFRHLPGYYKSMLRNEVIAFPVEEDPEGGYEMRLILHLLPDE